MINTTATEHQSTDLPPDLLVADIGGTKSSLCLANLQTGLISGTLRIYTNQQAADFITLYRTYCSEFAQANQIDYLSLSIAGQVVQQRCQMTNLDWQFDANQLQEQLRLKRVMLHNDLVATAWGIPSLPPEDFVVIQPGQQTLLPTSRLGIVSLGTGLGEATLIQPHTASQLPQIIPSEAGHRDFSVYDELSLALFQHALQHMDEQTPCLEYLLSGMGLVRIYHFLAERQADKAALAELTVVTPLASSGSMNAAIVARGIEQPESLAGQTLQLLARLLAREAANLALQNTCDAGIILAGGLAKRILPFLDTAEFIASFQQRDKFSAWLGSLTLSVCLNTEAPLWGTWKSIQYTHQG